MLFCIFVFLSFCLIVRFGSFFSSSHLISVHCNSLGSLLSSFYCLYVFFSFCLSLLLSLTVFLSLWRSVSVRLSSSLVHLSSSLFIGGRPGITWGLFSSFWGFVGWTEGMVTIGHRSSKSTFAANKKVFKADYSLIELVLTHNMSRRNAGLGRSSN